MTTHRHNPDGEANQQATKLKRLVRTKPEIRFPEEVSRIRAALNKLGYDASHGDIQSAYQSYSEETMCASWVSLGSFENDEWIAKILLGYLE